MHKIAWLSLAALALLPAAAAQAPEGTWSIDLEAGLPAAVRPDSATPFTWTLSIEGEGMLCLQDQPIVVALRPSASSVDGVFLELPAEANATVAMGEYLTDRFSADIPVDGRLLVARFAEQGASGSFTVTATLDPSGDTCMPDSAGSPEVSVDVVFSIEVVPEGDPLFHPTHEEHGAPVDAYLAPGESFTHRFDTPGVYSYHDHIDPARKGSVTVHGDEDAGDQDVAIGPGGFTPADLDVGVGSTVTWTNEDSTTRTVSFDELHGAEETEHGHDDDAMDGHGHEDESTSAPGILLAAVVVLAFAMRRRPAQPATV